MSRDVPEAAVIEAKELFLRCMQLESDQERDAMLASCESGVAARVRDLIASMDRGALIDRVFDVEGDAEVALTAEGQSSREDPTEFELREAVAESPGDRIDNYKLLEVIGEGGMGTVYMAQQLEPVKRKVAIKIVKPGMDSRHVVARFEAERQALALMDHPNIARIFDGGTTSVGRPYFVMELVKGIPLTDFCERRQLSLRDRLQLFVDVCHGVQHAHQRGIIHRDLKPSNVLVTLHDDKPVVKIIDFGIAKAMNQELTDKTMFTQFAALVGTPLYMSPEQAELSGLDVDTRSDVYSLGVMLYELLTGTTPFDRATLNRKGIDEVRRMIRETEPPRPSQRLSTVKASEGETLHTDRLREIKRTKSQLSGELDWIAMKALEKDRTRRYQAASAFGEDLQRYLDGEAVHACPPSSLYRMRKFASKHRYGFVTASILAVVILIGTAAASYQALRANAAEEVATANLDAALDAINRLMHHVGNQDLAEIPQTQTIQQEMLRDALQFYEQLEEQSGITSSDIQFQAAMVKRELGELLVDKRQWIEGAEVLREARSELGVLVEENPTHIEFRTGYARVLNRLAFSMMWGHGFRRRKADELRAECIQLYQHEQQQYRVLEQLDPANSSVYLQNVDKSKVDQAETYMIMSELKKSTDLVEPLWNKLRSEELTPHSERFGLLIIAQIRLANSLQFYDYERSKSLYIELLPKIDLLMECDLRRETRHRIARHLRDPPVTFLRFREWEPAIPFIKRAIDLSVALYQDFPTAAEYYNDLSQACMLAASASDLRLEEAVSANDELVLRDARGHRQDLIDTMAREWGVHLYPAQEMAEEDNAVQLLSSAMELYPASVAYQFYRGEVYRRNGLVQSAIADFREVCDRLEGHPIAPLFGPVQPHHRLGLIYLEQEDFAKALQSFSDQIAVDDRKSGFSEFSQFSLWERAKLSLKIQDYETCLNDLERLGVEQYESYFLDPDVVAFCEDSGFVSRYLERLDEGIDLLSGNVGWIANYALVQSKRGDHSLAIAKLQRAKLLRGVWPKCNLALVSCFLDQNQKYRAVCDELLLMSTGSLNETDLHHWVWNFCLADLPEKDSRRIIQVAENLNDSNIGSDASTYTGLLGAALFRGKDYERARKELTAALEMPQDIVASDAYLHYLLAMTSFHLGDSEQATTRMHAAKEIAAGELAQSPSWNRRMTLKLLRREAESLLSGD